MDRSELITRCIDEILEGKSSLDDCLKKHPELGDELRDLLTVASSLQKQGAAISPRFKREARSRLFANDGLAPLPGRGKGVFDWLKPVAIVNGLRVPVAALVVVVGLAGSGAGVVYAAQNSLPGEVLYPVKIGSENVRLAFTLAPESKARLNLELAGRRVDEAVAQSERGQDVSHATSEGVARHLDAAIKEIKNLDENQSKSLISQLSEATINQQATLSQALSDSPEEKKAGLEETIDASRRGSAVAVVADANPSFLDSSPSVSDEGLERTVFKLESILQSAGDDWNVGGITLSSVSAPKDAHYSVGSGVSIEGIIRNGQTFISSVRQKDGIGDQVKIEGVFGGTSADGSIWYISGIPVGKPQGLSPVPEGTELSLTGTMQNGNLVVATQASSDEQRDVRITGTLVEVSPDNATVVIEVAGAQITTNIANAEIQTESSASLEKSGLSSMIGKEVMVSGLRSRDGIIYASRIYFTGDSDRNSGDGQRKSD